MSGREGQIPRIQKSWVVGGPVHKFKYLRQKMRGGRSLLLYELGAIVEGIREREDPGGGGP